MSDIYDNFEKRFTSSCLLANNGVSDESVISSSSLSSQSASWFSAGWVEVLPTQAVEPTKETESSRKNLEDLQKELTALKSDVENISFKQLRLANLAKLYQV